MTLETFFSGWSEWSNPANADAHSGLGVCKEGRNTVTAHRSCGSNGTLPDKANVHPGGTLAVMCRHRLAVASFCPSMLRWSTFARDTRPRETSPCHRSESRDRRFGGALPRRSRLPDLAPLPLP